MQAIDEEIYVQLKVHRMEGMELLFKTYYKPLVAWAATFLRDVARSEDLVQDLFVKLWEKSIVDTLQPGTLQSYLFISVRNQALNRIDKIDPLFRASDVTHFESPWEDYDNFEEEVFKRVEVALEELPPRGREVIQCVYLKGMKYKEVAEELGISVATVNSLLVTALKKLRQRAGNEADVFLYLFFSKKKFDFD